MIMMSDNSFPSIVGVVNVTPDSFSDGGLYHDARQAVKHALSLLADGADMIEVGGESTRPGAESVPAALEVQRVVPVIEGIKSVNPSAVISIDTSKLAVAEKAVQAGADIINDVTALRSDPGIADFAADKGIPLVIMHMKGTPRDMQSNPEYADVVNEVYDHLEERIAFAREKGVKRVIADPGVGFGKTLAHNLELLRNLQKFRGLGVEIMLGISRKSFMKQLLDIEDAAERDLPTVLIHSLLMGKGVDFIRVHNVGYAAMLRKLKQALT